jgi:GMP synthase-like glutamine amidotransferase
MSGVRPPAVPGSRPRRPALVRQHGDTDPPGILGEWAALRGIELEVSRSDCDDGAPDLDGRPFVVSLGSEHSPLDLHLPAVVGELALLEEAVRRGIPVLGLCYGAQALATVLGGAVQHAPEPEIGWHRVQTSAPELIGEGPWLQWHYDRFTLPPGAVELARSPRALQVFARGPHLGVQFHPEATVETVLGWARKDAAHLHELGIDDGEALVQRGRRYARAARAAAMVLFDGFWTRARAQGDR